jgi:hypothetical protein
MSGNRSELSLKENVQVLQLLELTVKEKLEKISELARLVCRVAYTVVGTSGQTKCGRRYQ